MHGNAAPTMSGNHKKDPVMKHAKRGRVKFPGWNSSFINPCAAVVGIYTGAGCGGGIDRGGRSCSIS